MIAFACRPGRHRRALWRRREWPAGARPASRADDRIRPGRSDPACRGLRLQSREPGHRRSSRHGDRRAGVSLTSPLAERESSSAKTTGARDASALSVNQRLQLLRRRSGREVGGRGGPIVVLGVGDHRGDWRVGLCLVCSSSSFCKIALRDRTLAARTSSAGRT